MVSGLEEFCSDRKSFSCMESVSWVRTFIFNFLMFLFFDVNGAGWRWKPINSCELASALQQTAVG